MIADKRIACLLEKQEGIMKQIEEDILAEQLGLKQFREAA